MSDFVGIDVQGLDEVTRKLVRSIPACQDAIVDEVANYLVNVMKEQPTPNHSITRRRAYPETGDGFFTTKQRKWFFWALRTGRIQVPYHRTQAMQRAWKKYGSGKNAIVANEEEAAIWTMDNERQARFSALVGWQKVSEKIKARHDEILRRISIGTKKGLKQAGIKQD